MNHVVVYVRCPSDSMIAVHTVCYSVNTSGIKIEFSSRQTFDVTDYSNKYLDLITQIMERLGSAEIVHFDTSFAHQMSTRMIAHSVIATLRQAGMLCPTMFISDSDTKIADIVGQMLVVRETTTEFDFLTAMIDAMKKLDSDLILNLDLMNLLDKAMHSFMR